ncbi:hypothetical protein YC2023_059534 [Brassica napus]
MASSEHHLVPLSLSFCFQVTKATEASSDSSGPSRGCHGPSHFKPGTVQAPSRKARFLRSILPSPTATSPWREGQIATRVMGDCCDRVLRFWEAWNLKKGGEESLWGGQGMENTSSFSTTTICAMLGFSIISKGREQSRVTLNNYNAIQISQANNMGFETNVTDVFCYELTKKYQVGEDEL